MFKIRLAFLFLVLCPIVSFAQNLLPEMVFVQGDTFMMGSNDKDDDKNQKPEHTVKISDFYIGKYEVTQRQWKTIMGKNPSQNYNCEDCPVENIRYFDIQFFIEKLNRITGIQYRLPTEAEWEFAAKGGNKSKHYLYSGSNDIDSVAWTSDNTNRETQPVGGLNPNELGIFDMTGNVWEWCNDYFERDYYSKSPIDNPFGPLTGDEIVLRGGCAGQYGKNSFKTTVRSHISYYQLFSYGGFRLATNYKKTIINNKPVVTILDSNFNYIKYILDTSIKNFKVVPKKRAINKPLRIVTINVPKASFYSLPDIKTKRNGYFLIKEQKVTIYKVSGDFVYVEYINERGKITSGWLLKADTR